MKILTKIFILFFIFLGVLGFTEVNANQINNINQINLKTGLSVPENNIVDKNTPLKALKNSQTDFTIARWWQKWILNWIIKIARDLKNLFFFIAWVYFLILVLKLLFSEKTEEEVWNFKKWIVWTSIWIIITQISYYFINILFDKDINAQLSVQFADMIIKPFINILELSASFFFLAIMIYAFYRIITANGDDEKAKSWKMSVLYAAVWFIIIRISETLVSSIYWKTSCSGLSNTNCLNQVNLSWVSEIIVNIIDWVNGFIWIVVIILIIYAGFLVLISIWDEEKLKKAKSIILYIALWLLILVVNYLILTFFIIPESII